MNYLWFYQRLATKTEAAKRPAQSAKKQCAIKYMMRFTVALILTLASLSVQAEPVTRSKTVICDNITAVFQTIIGEYKEQPTWHGISPGTDTELTLTVNPQTGSWTLIEYKDSRACIISIGERSSQRISPQGPMI
jgi:hypothetical protein